MVILPCRSFGHRPELKERGVILGMIGIGLTLGLVWIRVLALWWCGGGFPCWQWVRFFGACSDGVHACWCIGLAPLGVGVIGSPGLGRHYIVSYLGMIEAARDLGVLIVDRVRIGVRDWG